MIDDLKKKAEELMHDEKVQSAVDKAKDFINSPEGKAKIEDAKEKLGDIKEKVEDFVHDKTGGKGILGFGADK